MRNPEANQHIYINVDTTIRLLASYNAPPWNPESWRPISTVEATDLQEMIDDAEEDEAAAAACASHGNNETVYVAHDADGTYYAVAI